VLVPVPSPLPLLHPARLLRLPRPAHLPKLAPRLAPNQALNPVLGLNLALGLDPALILDLLLVVKARELGIRVLQAETKALVALARPILDPVLAPQQQRVPTLPPRQPRLIADPPTPDPPTLAQQHPALPLLHRPRRRVVLPLAQLPENLGQRAVLLLAQLPQSPSLRPQKLPAPLLDLSPRLDPLLVAAGSLVPTLREALGDFNSQV